MSLPTSNSSAAAPQINQNNIQSQLQAMTGLLSTNIQIDFMQQFINFNNTNLLQYNILTSPLNIQLSSVNLLADFDNNDLSDVA